MPRPPRTALALAALAAGALAARAGTAESQVVAGRVVTDLPRRPMPGVRVRVLRAGPDSARAVADTGAAGEAVSAADGVFSVLLPRPGTYRVQIAGHAPGPPLALLNPDSTDSREYVMPAAAPDSSARGSNGPTDAELDVILRSGLALQPSQVDRLACVIPSNGGPAYPFTQARLGLSVSFGAIFAVDTLGHPDVRTLRVRDAPDPAFVDAVREWLPLVRMAPAEVRGRRVPQLAWVPVTFVLPGRPYPPRAQPPPGFEAYTLPGAC